MKQVAISVITASLNSERHIGRTLASVASQRDISCEHVVVDGGSTDGTLYLLAQHLGSNGAWISEPDSGIADAMNKGIALSHGEWLLFLQSDDFLVDDAVLAKALALLDREADICGFPVLFGDERSSVLTRPRGPGVWLNFKTGLNHQGSFIRRSLFERIGPYDTSFRIAMDYEFFLRASRAGAKIRCYTGPAIALMRDTGLSSQRDWPNLRGRLSEERRIHRKFQTPWLAPAYLAWWSLYPAYRWMRSRLSRLRS